MDISLSSGPVFPFEWKLFPPAQPQTATASLGIQDKGSLSGGEHVQTLQLHWMTLSVTEYPDFGGTNKDNQVWLLALHRTTPENGLEMIFPVTTTTTLCSLLQFMNYMTTYQNQE